MIYEFSRGIKNGTRTYVFFQGRSNILEYIKIPGELSQSFARTHVNFPGGNISKEHIRFSRGSCPKFRLNTKIF